MHKRGMLGLLGVIGSLGSPEEMPEAESWRAISASQAKSDSWAYNLGRCTPLQVERPYVLFNALLWLT